MQSHTLRSTRSLVAAIVLLAVVAAAGLWGAGRPSASEVASQSGGGQPEFAIDVTDKAALSDFADNVFFGIVIRQSGSDGIPHREGGGAVPMTQFDVEVTTTIKGSLAGIVNVNQYGGLDKEVNEVVVFEGDHLLEPGEEYLLVTKLNVEFGWQTIVAPVYGNIRIENDDMRAEVRAAFEQATGLTTVPAGTAQPNGSFSTPQAPIATEVTPEGTPAPSQAAVAISSNPSVPGNVTLDGDLTTWWVVPASDAVVPGASLEAFA